MPRSIFVAAMVTSMTLASASQATITVATVPVGNAGNAADPATGYGAVAFSFQMGKFEITASQYAAFLNAVASTSDANALYVTTMASNTQGCKIQRTTVSGVSTYTVTAGYENRPANFISWTRAARFANWMHNGQPTGPQSASTTEDGSYLMNSDIRTITRSANADWVIPSEDEWTKAAYQKNDGATAHYFLYPTSSDSAPGRLLNDIAGNNANFGAAPSNNPIDSPYFTTLGGEFENSASPYGAFDMGGNVTEWTEGIDSPSLTTRIARGGSWQPNSSFLQSTIRSPTATGSAASNLIGFRLAFVPGPSSGLLLALAGLTAARRRR